MHTFKLAEKKAVDKVIDIFEALPDGQNEVSLIKLYFDDKGFITDVESLTEDQRKKIRLDIIKAMPDTEPPPPMM